MDTTGIQTDKEKGQPKQDPILFHDKDGTQKQEAANERDSGYIFGFPVTSRSQPV
jgi:hypothetical protein